MENFGFKGWLEYGISNLGFGKCKNGRWREMDQDRIQLEALLMAVLNFLLILQQATYQTITKSP